MMTSRSTIITLLLCVALLTSACLRDFARSVAESRAAQQELKNKFGDEVEVSSNTSGNHTTVVIVFTDSKLNNQTREARGRRALEAAQIAKKKYSETAPNEFDVQFHRNSPDAGVFAPPQFVDVFQFDGELRAISRVIRNPPGVVVPTEEATTRAVFLNNAGESDVAAAAISLDGPPGQGLSLIPHFTVTGDANKQKASPPREVSFDFAAYYSYEKFKEEIQFKFIVDDQSVLATKGRFTRSTAPGVVTQFCYLKIPYAAFTRLTNGENLRIQVGTELYELSKDQYQSIKKMTTFVK